MLVAWWPSYTVSLGAPAAFSSSIFAWSDLLLPSAISSGSWSFLEVYHSLRYIHEQKLKRRATRNANGTKPVTLLINDEVESASSCAGVHDQWRPSVYKVFFCLIRYHPFIPLLIFVPSSFSALLLSLAALLYTHTEAWNFVDALYFCFTRWLIFHFISSLVQVSAVIQFQYSNKTTHMLKEIFQLRYDWIWRLCLQPERSQFYEWGSLRIHQLRIAHDRCLLLLLPIQCVFHCC